MDIKENFDKLSDATQQYIDMRVDSAKLHIVEKLSIMCNEVLSYVVVSLLVVMALFFMLIAAVAFLAPIIGFVYSVLSVAGLLVIIAIVLFFMRKKLFLNVMVKCFCRMFFDDKTNENE